MIFSDWVIDITMSRDGMMCFVPMDEDESLITGMSYFSDRCPGDLVGVYHQDGYSAACEWMGENPGWYEKYSRLT